MDTSTGIELILMIGASIASILGATFWLGRKVQTVINSINTLSENVTTLEELIGEETKNIWKKIKGFDNRLGIQGDQLDALTKNVETICKAEREG